MPWYSFMPHTLWAEAPVPDHQPCLDYSFFLNNISILKPWLDNNRIHTMCVANVIYQTFHYSVVNKSLGFKGFANKRGTKTGIQLNLLCHVDYTHTHTHTVNQSSTFALPMMVGNENVFQLILFVVIWFIMPLQFEVFILFSGWEANRQSLGALILVQSQWPWIPNARIFSKHMLPGVWIIADYWLFN